VFTVLTDFMNWYFGKLAINNENIICARESYIIVNANIGAGTLLFHSTCIMGYSLFMYVIFYRIPRIYKLISYNKFGTRKLEAS